MTLGRGYANLVCENNQEEECWQELEELCNNKLKTPSLTSDAFSKECQATPFKKRRLEIHRKKREGNLKCK